MKARLKHGMGYLTVAVLVLLQATIHAIDPCKVSENHIDPAGIPSQNGVRRTAIGCRASPSGNFQVHVLGDYGNTTANESGHMPRTSQVNIRGNSSSPIVLVLLSAGHVAWNIESHEAVPLAVVVLMSDNSHTSVNFTEAQNTTAIQLQKETIPLDSQSMENATQLVKYLSGKFQSVTSFSASSGADRWVLVIGHQKEPLPPISTQTTEDPVTAAAYECLQADDCWLQYSFTYDDNWNDCHGEQYVTQTNFTVGKYVGVVLCSASRYKLFMADSLQEKFLNMADGSGAGEDWCVVIGGDESLARLSSNTFDSPTAIGYYRSYRGEIPQKAKIGFGPKDMSEWTGLYYPTWYECGVDIPGKSRVVALAATTTMDPIDSCLSSTDCWLKYDFFYDDSWTGCSGERYVRTTPYDVGRYIGVILCSADRYKLVMADNLEDKFLNIGDGSGAGEDLCELIGGNIKSAKIPMDFWQCPTNPGFYRSFKGDALKRGKIGHSPEWTGKYYPTWYECGIAIPGVSHVVTKSAPSSTTVSTIPTTTTAAPPATANPWDNVPFGQVKFTVDRTFIVPNGVTRVDVVCIGGGGGGRDGHATGIVTGDGGNSTFGPYLMAGGGKGAQADNSGGEGGYGTVANGGQGGQGGGCSAGAGAAGQTSGGGHNGLEGGSSTNPFCGGGGSSGGSSCGQIFDSIQPGQSGPGGINPKGRAGGLYGGGGGSRAGGRAGGGGGYSRGAIAVVPGQRIPIMVGEAGTPAYWAGKSAQGIVVVSWGGPINALGAFVDQFTVSGSAPPTTAAPTTTPETSLPRKTCPRFHCSGSYRMQSACVNGFCECSATGYNKYTCLPEVGSCRILSNQDNALATPIRSSNVHSCVGSSVNSSYEVHVIGIYEPAPRGSSVTVNIKGTRSKPIVLVFANYEHVTWIIEAEPELDVREIKLFAYNEAQSRVQYAGLTNSSQIVYTKSSRPIGYGDDSGGGSTKDLLILLKDKYGDVASFTGTYRTSHWNLVFPGSKATRTPQMTVSVSPTSTPPTTAAPTTTAVTSLPRKACRHSYCSGSYHMRSACVNGFCECSATGYNKYTCLPEVGSCRILSNQDNALATPIRSSGYDVHSCVGSLANSSYEVHIIGIYEPAPRGSSVTVNIKGTTSKPIVLVFANYEPVTWIIEAEPELDVREIKLFAYNEAQSRVQYAGLTNSSQIVYTKSSRPRGYGDDSGGGNTKDLLILLKDKYGDVASFTGTYRTSHWNLVFPGSKATTTPKMAVSVSPTSNAVASCLSSSSCWLKYNFTYDDSWNACHGEQYVRKTPYIIGKYIGVILCSADRYKLVMADDLNKKFLNIGDGNGSGEDLCELVGSDINRAKLPSDFWNSPSVEGYYRYNAGQTPEIGKIGYGPKDGSQWTGKYFPTWYECGVSIPGNMTVVSYPQGPVDTTSAATTPTTSTWDPVPFGQRKFKTDATFVVPPGVTKVDVICIGGGGGGRDNHVPFSRNAGHGGNGGNSTFGDYLWAEGGKGATKDNEGGEGGWGLTADGGPGGIGGGCSAGAGAAGQTSGGGAGGLEAGSSTNPFCGAGGSSGGTSCGNEFESIAPGKSGPGGKDPQGRAGGLYGGGGGSRAGARAGGGGGYSQAIITVTPGEEIKIAVGDIGTPYYTGGRPAPGVVVVSWGGSINPLGTFTN